jgi:DNA-directed RNA polymerase subunit RPC12/RpoP
MTEKPKRPILHLKFPPATPIAVPGVPAASAAPASPLPTQVWKCKPCGKPFQVLSELADEDSVRCPACNARLGLASDFRADPPQLERVRARLAVEAPPAAPPPSPRRTFVRESIGSRRAR